MVSYSPEIAKKICVLISQGLTPEKICESPDMPNASSIYSWCIEYPEFLTMYELARERQMEVYSNDIINLTNNVREDVDAVAKVKLQLHARQWLMGKLKPKKYGDSTTIKGDKDNPLTITLSSALDHAIAARAATGKVIEHESSVPMIGHEGDSDA